jgi:hypothetical protein
MGKIPVNIAQQLHAQIRYYFLYHINNSELKISSIMNESVNCVNICV